MEAAEKAVSGVFLLFCSRDTADILAYIVLCIAVLLWFVKVDVSKSVTGISLLAVRLLTLCLFLVMAILLSVLAAGDGTATFAAENVRKTYEVREETADIAASAAETKCFSLISDYYTASGVLCCSIYTMPDMILSETDIICSETFCETIVVEKDEAADNKYNVIFNNFVRDTGCYEVSVRDTDCIFRIHISAELSERVLMSCTPSAAEAAAGDTITLLLEYTGQDIVNGTAAICFEDTAVLLRNCVGTVTSDVRVNTVCVTVTNIGVLDTDKAFSVEISPGTARDSTGAPVNGAIADLNYIS